MMREGYTYTYWQARSIFLMHWSLPSTAVQITQPLRNGKFFLAGMEYTPALCGADKKPW